MAIPSRIHNFLVYWLTILSVFSLIFRRGSFVKVFDVLIVIIGILLIANPESFIAIKKFFIKFKYAFFTIIFLIIFIIFAQLLSYALGNNIDINFEIFKNHGRLIFNVYTLFLVGFLISYNKKILFPVSWAIIFSPIIVLPAYWNLNEEFFISGGRLTGFLQTPIIFGAWMMVVFLIGIGFFFTLQKKWQKTLLLLWLAIIANFILWAASRASWLALIAAIFILITFYFLIGEKKKSGIIFLIFIFTFSVGYILLPSKDLKIKAWVLDRSKNLAESIVVLHPEKIQGQMHTTTLPNAVRFISQNSMGSGFGDYTAMNLGILNKGDTVSNSSYLELALYGGVGALFMFLLFLFGVGKEIRKILLSRKLSDLEIVWIVACLAFLIDIFFTDGFLWRHTWFMLGVVIGIVHIVDIS